MGRVSRHESFVDDPIFSAAPKYWAWHIYFLENIELL